MGEKDLHRKKGDTRTFKETSQEAAEKWRALSDEEKKVRSTTHQAARTSLRKEEPLGGTKGDGFEGDVRRRSTTRAHTSHLASFLPSPPLFPSTAVSSHAPNQAYSPTESDVAAYASKVEEWYAALSPEDQKTAYAIKGIPKSFGKDGRKEARAAGLGQYTYKRGSLPRTPYRLLSFLLNSRDPLPPSSSCPPIPDPD